MQTSIKVSQVGYQLFIKVYNLTPDKRIEGAKLGSRKEANSW
jgi:hypothetical protein